MERINTLDTLRVHSLDLKDLPFSEEEIQRKFSLVICDVDYTLIDFEPANQAALIKLKEFFGEKMGEWIDRIFQIVLVGNRKKEDEPWKARDEYNSYMRRITELQPEDSKRKYGVKVWSREAYIILAAERAGVKVDKEKVEQARDIYWKELGINYKLYKDAEEFLSLLSRQNIPLVLMTGSDAVLNVNPDLTLNYDPEFSRQYKLRRISSHFPNVLTIVGDPIDKQYPEYFYHLFEEVKKIGEFPKEKTLIIGDSEKADLMFPRKMGYPTLLVPARR